MDAFGGMNDRPPRPLRGQPSFWIDDGRWREGFPISCFLFSIGVEFFCLTGEHIGSPHPCGPVGQWIDEGDWRGTLSGCFRGSAFVGRAGGSGVAGWGRAPKAREAIVRAAPHYMPGFYGETSPVLTIFTTVVLSAFSGTLISMM